MMGYGDLTIELSKNMAEITSSGIPELLQTIEYCLYISLTFFGFRDEVGGWNQPPPPATSCQGARDGEGSDVD